MDIAAVAVATLISVVVGKNPEAVVRDGGRVRVIHVGNVLEGRHVRSITVRGIVLSNGHRLVIASGGKQPHAPRAFATAQNANGQTIVREPAQRASYGGVSAVPGYPYATIVTGVNSGIPCSTTAASLPAPGQQLGTAPMPVPAATVVPCR